jgi:hypothetical protein
MTTKRNRLEGFELCSNPDPTTFNCGSTEFRNCVMDKHGKSEPDFTAMLVNESNEGRVVYVDNLPLASDSCGQKLIKVLFNPGELNSNEDISVSVIDWPADPPIPGETEMGWYAVYFSDVLINAVIREYNLKKLVMHKAKEGDYPSVAFEGKNVFGTIKYRGNLTSQFPVIDSVLP